MLKGIEAYKITTCSNKHTRTCHRPHAPVTDYTHLSPTTRTCHRPRAPVRHPTHLSHIFHRSHATATSQAHLHRIYWHAPVTLLRTRYRSAIHTYPRIPAHITDYDVHALYTSYTVLSPTTGHLQTARWTTAKGCSSVPCCELTNCASGM